MRRRFGEIRRGTYEVHGKRPSTTPYMCPVGVWEAQESRSFKTVHHFEHVLWEGVVGSEAMNM